LFGDHMIPNLSSSLDGWFFPHFTRGCPFLGET
jgi:hypothetical protein